MAIKKRLIFLDIARGLAILYIIQLHVLNYHVVWVDSWAMPVFFIIMGLFFKPTSTWQEMIVKKSKTLLIPYVLLSIPSFIQYAIQLPMKDFLKKIIDPFNCIHGVAWFLICMFWCYIVYYGIHRISKGKMLIKFLISICVSFFFYYISTIRLDMVGGHRLVLPLFLSTSFTCVIFVALGEVLKKYILSERILSYKRLIIISILSVSGTFGLKLGGGEMIINFYYGQPYILWVIVSFLGCIVIIEICKYFPSFLSFFGEHSLLMLMIHPYIKRVILLFIEPSILSLILIIILTSLLVYLCARYLPITEGKI